MIRLVIQHNNLYRNMANVPKGRSFDTELSIDFDLDKIVVVDEINKVFLAKHFDVRDRNTVIAMYEKVFGSRNVTLDWLLNDGFNYIGAI